MVTEFMETHDTFPALFIGHGSPSNVLHKEGKYYKSLMKFIESIRQPEAIIFLSAHWETETIEITSWNVKFPLADNNEENLLQYVKHSFTGDPTLARTIKFDLKKKGINSKINTERGIDSGVWCPYTLLFDGKDIPVVQLSMPLIRTPKTMFKLGKSLISFRNDCLIIGSGNIVYNRKIMHQAKDVQISGWAKDFDDWIEENLFGDIDTLFEYKDIAPNANYAAITTEHIDPMFFVLGLKSENEKVKTVYEGFEYSTTSMRCFEIR